MAKERKKRQTPPLSNPHTPFQEWVQKVLNDRGWNSALLAEMTNRLPGTVWKAVAADPNKYDGAGAPGYALALDIGKALGKEVRALLAANHDVPAVLWETLSPEDIQELKAAGYDIPENAGADSPRPAEYKANERFGHDIAEAREVYGSSAEIIRVPFIGAVSASAEGGISDEDFTGEFLPVFVGMLPSKATRLFAFHVVGECLTGAHIVSGDVMICEPAAEAKTGEIVIVEDRTTGERMAKRFRLLPDGSALLETYPAYGRPEIVSVSPEAHIVGVARLIQRIPGR